jgi:MATE family multidrug resistance protein
MSDVSGKSRTDAPSAAEDSHWRVEAVETLRLAWPIALTQLGQIGMMTTDLAMIGRLGDAAVAAASLAHTVLFAAFVVGMGLVSAVAPLAAQGFGARKPRIVRRALRVGLWAAVIAGVPLTGLQWWGHEILIGLGQAPDTATMAARYLAGLSWCLIPSFIFIALRGFMGAVNRPEPALWITLVALPINAVLAYGLINGAFGLPHLDLLGAGLATTIVNIGMCLAAMWIVAARRPFRKFQPLHRFWRPDWVLGRQLFSIGLPISGAFMLEFGVFAAAGLLMGRIGTAALAGHQIALQTAAVMFMVPFGISMAATVRVGHSVGRRDAPAARRAGFTAIGLAVIFMASMVLVVLLSRSAVPALFLGSITPATQATADVAAMLLAIGASFFICDGVQTVAAGALRGLNDTRVPLAFAIVGFWIVAFPSAYALAFPLGLGAAGVWIGLSAGLAAFAVMLVTRFHLLTRHGSIVWPGQPSSG